MGGQTAYFLDSDTGVPGMLADLDLDSKILSFPAGESIPFGRLCEVNASGILLLVRGVSNAIASGKLAGVSVLDVAREQQLAASGGSAGSGFYVSGEMVPVLRKGRIFAAWDNSTQALSQAPFVQPNVNHPSGSDASGIRGVFSGGTVSVVAGAEISVTPAEILMVKDVSGASYNSGQGSVGAPRRQATGTNDYEYICLLEVNLPGA